jgi:fructose-1,6-bisphosphatase
LGVYALDIGGPEAAHWAHLSGEIRAISADTWLSEPASGVHTFDATVAIVADPTDACSELSNDVSGKVVIVFEADDDSCTEAEQAERIVAAGGVAVVMVGTSYMYRWTFSYPYDTIVYTEQRI